MLQTDVHSTESEAHSQIYTSLLLPYSTNPTPAELAYQAGNFQKTKGTLFIIPPSESMLRSSYNAPPRPKTRMSSGAVALCKHFERIPNSPHSKRDQASGQLHPYWTEPRGSNDDKTRIAAQILDAMLSDACWRNVMLLHHGVVVYEIRNRKGWGMRWTLEIEETATDVSGGIEEYGISDKDSSPVNDSVDASSTNKGAKSRAPEESITSKNTTVHTHGSITSTSTRDEMVDEDFNNKDWKITDVKFRGFLEPIEGMNHELLD